MARKPPPNPSQLDSMRRKLLQDREKLISELQSNYVQMFEAGLALSGGSLEFRPGTIFETVGGYRVLAIGQTTLQALTDDTLDDDCACNIAVVVFPPPHGVVPRGTIVGYDGVHPVNRDYDDRHALTLLRVVRRDVVLPS